MYLFIFSLLVTSFLVIYTEFNMGFPSGSLLHSTGDLLHCETLLFFCLTTYEIKHFIRRGKESGMRYDCCLVSKLVH